MIFEIKDTNKALVGTLSFSETGAPSWVGERNEEFVQMVEDFYASGVSPVQHLPTTTESSLIFPSNPLFPLTLVHTLKSCGYDVTELHPEVDAEIKDILVKVPDDNPIKKGLLNELPMMTHLEKTFILERLKGSTVGDFGIF